MSFHVRVALSGVHQEPARSIVAIGDTILITESGQVNFTLDIPRKYSDISYILEDDEPEQKPKSAAAPATNDREKKSSKQQQKKGKDSSEEYDKEDDESEDEDGSADILKSGLNGNLKSSRLRSQANQDQGHQDNVEDRKDNQKNLLRKKQTELKIRLDKGQIKFASKKKKVKKMNTLVAYKSPSEIPKDYRPGKIYVDVNKHAVLIPNSPTSFIPVHVGCIKSVSDSVQAQWTILRINFHT